MTDMLRTKYRNLLGKVSDSEIARMLGCGVATVQVVRANLKIPVPGAKFSGSAAARFLGEHYRNLMGISPDHIIAKAAGCSTAAVSRTRKMFGIPAYSRYIPPVNDREILACMKSGRIPDPVVMEKAEAAREYVDECIEVAREEFGFTPVKVLVRMASFIAPNETIEELTVREKRSPDSFDKYVENSVNVAEKDHGISPMLFLKMAARTIAGLPS